MLLFTCCLLSVWLLMPLIWCGKAGQRQSASVTCLKCLSHLILEPSEKCSPRWKDEAIQNGNIYPPSQHSFSSSLSVWVSFGALMINIELFTKNGGAASNFLPFAWKKKKALNDMIDSVLIWQITHLVKFWGKKSFLFHVFGLSLSNKMNNPLTMFQRNVWLWSLNYLMPLL